MLGILCQIFLGRTGGENGSCIPGKGPVTSPSEHCSLSSFWLGQMSVDTGATTYLLCPFYVLLSCPIPPSYPHLTPAPPILSPPPPKPEPGRCWGE